MRLCPWSLALASEVSVLGKAVLGFGFFCVLGLEPCVLDSTSGSYQEANYSHLDFFNTVVVDLNFVVFLTFRYITDTLQI